MSAHAPRVGAERLLEAVRQRTTLFGTFSVLDDAFTAETLARAGFDFVLVDLQHGFADLRSVTALMQGIEAGQALPVVRVRDNSVAEIGAALDHGAAAVVVPWAETPVAVAAAVAACRYPPAGVRSFGPFRSRTATALDAAGPAPCLVMVESAESVEAIDAIAAVEGLAGVFVGPTDLAISLGLPADYDMDDPRHDEPVRRIAAACRRAGVLAGIQTSSAKEAARRVEQGYTVVSMRSDFAVVGSGMRQMLRECGSLVPAQPDRAVRQSS